MKSISYKIALGYVVIIFINFTISIFAIYYLNRLSSPLEESVEKQFQNVSASESMVQSLVQLELVQYELLNKGYNSGLLVEFHTYKNEFLNWHQRAVEGVSETMDVQVLDTILSQFTAYVSQSEMMQDQLNTTIKREQLQSIYYQEILPTVKKIETQCTQLIQINRAAIENARIKANQLSKLAKTIIIIFSIVAILFSIIASIYFTKNVVKPIKRTINSVKKISEGQLNQKIFISSKDEIAELGKEFNKMTDRLYEYEQMNIRQILTEKRKSEAIVAGMPVSIIVTDKDFKLSLVNAPAKKQLGLEKKNWEGKRVDEIIDDISLVHLLSGRDKSYEKEFDPSKSIITLNRQEKTVYLLARQVKITDAEEGISAIVTMLQDVTSFKELDHLKSEFIAIISHQIKTPLTSIIMIIDILLKEVKGKINEPQRDLLSDAKFDSDRLKDFILNLLQFSRLETGNTDFTFINIDMDSLEEMIEDVIKPLKPMIQQKKATFTKELRRPLSNFQADRQNFSLVLSNILDNALAYIDNGGQIDLVVVQIDNYIQFKIHDNGIGIPDEKIPFIFDKFVQANSFQNNESGSIGLGLAIAKEIVNAHKGQIWVSSRPGEGSTFHINLPVGD